MLLEKIQEMEQYAVAENIPIMEKDGIAFLKDYIQRNHIKRVLEIGTAIGYSAIQMASVTPDLKIVTIERDPIRYQKAIQNIQEVGLESQIEVLCQDAYDVVITEMFDCIFIDAAKSQYQAFFEKFTPFLKKGGVVISDNLSFHGLVAQADSITSKNLKALVRKIKRYITFLEENEQFTTTFYTIGDGIAISIKKE